MTSTNQSAGQATSGRAIRPPLPGTFDRQPGSSNRGFASMDPERQRDASHQAGKKPQTGGNSGAAGSASSGGDTPAKGTPGR